MRRKSAGHWFAADVDLIVAGSLGLAAVSMYSCGGSKSSPMTASNAGTGGTSTDGAAQSGATGTSGNCSSNPMTAENTASVVAAANAFLSALTTDQRTVAELERTQANAIQWSNFPAGVVPRNGVRLADMSEDAQSAAVALVAVAAGNTGATMFSEIRAADDAYQSISGDESLFGDGQYYVSLHGVPSTSSDWMLQIAGHHIAYNFSYNGVCTSATPLFDGAQPAEWTDQNGAAHDPLASQRNSMAALFAAVQSVDGAKLGGTYTDMINGPAASMGAQSAIDSNYPAGLMYPTTNRGASVASFSADEASLVKAVIEAWVNNVAGPVSSALLADYESDAALAQTFVGYSGATDLSTTSSYGRIDGPRVWIEFTVQEGTAGGTQGHYHTIWRDKAADYGADFVSQ
jgi:Protein of unknown function (DUF3500)